MIPRRLLTILVFALPILVTGFAVVLGAALLAQALGDLGGARGLFWTGMGALLLLVIDVLLLVGVLGLLALDQRHDRDEET